MTAATGSPARRGAAAALAGVLFGAGLVVAQMTDPAKVLAFLDVAGAWDPSLMLVMGGAVAITFVGYRWALGREAPLLDARFHLPASKAIDRPLVAGSALFGLGWGLAGYCPGPALASIGFGNPEALWVVPAMAAGAALHRLVIRYSLK